MLRFQCQLCRIGDTAQVALLQGGAAAAAAAAARAAILGAIRFGFSFAVVIVAAACAVASCGQQQAGDRMPPNGASNVSPALASLTATSPAILPPSLLQTPAVPSFKYNTTQLLIQKPIEGIKRKFEKRNCDAATAALTTASTATATATATVTATVEATAFHFVYRNYINFTATHEAKICAMCTSFVNEGGYNSLAHKQNGQ